MQAVHGELRGMHKPQRVLLLQGPVPSELKEHVHDMPREHLLQQDHQGMHELPVELQGLRREEHMQEMLGRLCPQHSELGHRCVLQVSVRNVRNSIW